MLATMLIVACTSPEKQGGGGAGDDVVVAAVATPDALVPDATPSADGSDIAYVTAGADPSLLVVGETEALASLTDPVAIVATPDGASYLVADADSVSVVPVDGGTPEPLSGAGGLGATALEIRTDLYISGTDAIDGSGAVYRLTLTGGTAELVATGLPEVPSGLAIGAGGEIYAAGGDSVYAIVDGAATPLLTGLRLDAHAGIALTPGDSALLVSSRSEVGTAQLLRIDVETLGTSALDDRISENEGAAGLHRAQGGATTYAWAGVSQDGDGVVYRIDL